MSLTPQQLQVLKTVLRVGKQTGASPKEIKAAVETGLVESNLTNPSGGDADSAGWRQERASLYPNPTNVAASAKRFFSETHAVKGKYGSAGALAAAVQRPAAQYRGRYQQRSGDAESILAKLGGSVGATPAGAASSTTTTTSNAADVAQANQTNQRRALVANYLSKSAPGSPLIQSGILDPVAVPGLKTLSTTRTTKATGVTQPGAPPSGGKGSSSALDWAKSTIGVSETGGPNRGKRVDSWEQRFNLKGQPWCAVFTSLAVTKGGVAASGRTPSVAEVRKQAQQGTAAYQRGFIPPKRAQAGDLILFGNDHIGMVESVGKGGITMIAGNDSNKVQRRVVPIGSGDIVRPKYRR